MQAKVKLEFALQSLNTTRNITWEYDWARSGPGERFQLLTNLFVIKPHVFDPHSFGPSRRISSVLA